MILCMLVAVAAAGAVMAPVTDSTRLAYATAGLAGLCVLVLGGVMRRANGVGGASDTDIPEQAGEVPQAAAAPVAENSVPEAADDALVRVIAGRKRFHHPDCGLVSARESESLTLLEAREEGFTPCSECHPGARARR